jgi:Tfp pilus assembly protein PilV
MNGCSHSARRESAFTFAEVLAAMVFMAIVIPVAMSGLQLSNRAGVVAERKLVAAQLADKMLNELSFSNTWRTASQSGTFDPPWKYYRWQFQQTAWTEANMRLLTVMVYYPAQNEEYFVRVSTLVQEITE